MANKYNHFALEQLEKKLLAMLDDVDYRVTHHGVPMNPMMAEINGTLTLEGLAREIQEAGQAYRGRLVMNRFRLAPYDAAEPLMIDDDKPSQAARDFVSQISALVKQGKVIKMAEFLKYKSVFEKNPKWQGARFYPAPDDIKKMVVGDDESLSDGRRPNGWPTAEDEEFVLVTLKSLVKHSFVVASDADRYEAIMREHPEFAKLYPARVRGSDARHYVALRNGTAIKKALSKKLK